MASILFDQSHIHRCPVHGRRSAGWFITPSAGEFFAAFYCCLMKPKEAGVLTHKTITREDAMKLQQPCSK